MGHSIRNIGAGMIGLALFLSATAPAEARHEAPSNRGVDSVHQPIVSRTDFVLDLATGPGGLVQGESERLSGWFEGLGISYGDSISVDHSAVWQGAVAEDAVSAVAARYGMLITHDSPPATVGHPASGTLRVVVSRAIARVEGCPDWSRGGGPDYSGTTQSNYGCATAINLAAQIANPEDLVEGRSDQHSSDAMLSVKAIKTYKDAVNTGSGGLKSVSSNSSGGK